MRPFNSSIILLVLFCSYAFASRSGVVANKVDVNKCWTQTENADVEVKKVCIEVVKLTTDASPSLDDHANVVIYGTYEDLKGVVHDLDITSSTTFPANPDFPQNFSTSLQSKTSYKEDDDLKITAKVNLNFTLNTKLQLEPGSISVEGLVTEISSADHDTTKVPFQIN